MAQGKQIDPDVFGAFMDIAEEEAPAMIATYISKAEECLAEMLRAHETGDQNTLSRAAHTLKSSSGQIGALNLQELARKVENESAGMHPPALVEVLRQMKAVFAGVREELQAV